MAMRRRDFSWSIALCASLIAHAALIKWRADRYVADHSGYRLGGFNGLLQALADKRAANDADELGDSHGRGIATDASLGDTPMQAPQADEQQSFLSRDPQGPGAVGAKPSPSTELPGEQGQNGTQTAQQPFGLTSSQSSSAQSASPRFAAAQQSRQKPDSTEGPIPKPSPLSPPSTPSAPAQPAVASAAQMPGAASTLAGRPGENTPPADPAPQAETESDPFAIVGSMEFRPGSTTVRLGRKHRITRPHLPWDAQYDFFGMTHSVIVLDLQLDPTGQVIGATIVKSSGSDGVDQACRLAAYQWWFEPAKDPTGRPIRDDITFTIKFM
jgi:TonB family protein